LQRLVSEEAVVVLKAGRLGLPRVVRVEFWELVGAGVPWTVAGARCGAEKAAERWFRDAGGVRANGVRRLGGRYLGVADREEIAVGLAAGDSLRVIAARIGRPASTVCREVARNRTTKGQYRAVSAQAAAEYRARRPKTAKLAADPVLAQVVQDWLEAKRSPRQISRRLAIEFPGRPEMRVSHETIYQSIYVQGRGALRRELAACLRTGRALRRPRRAAGQQQPKPGTIRDMIMISERPPEVADRAVPGHWEGDLILGKDGTSAIGTLVERSTRFCLLLHLPRRRDAATVAAAMTETMLELPAHLRKSLTWDQGKEMARHAEITLATGLDIYFCDPHSPWQRGSNENTNGLLRQYFPKGTVLSGHSKTHLDAVAAELNDRPRQTLHWRTPAEALTDLLSNPPDNTGVATTP
jgi:IS30 family transposase